MSLRLLVVFLLLPVLSCASTQLGKGSLAWQRIHTEHFTLYTDLPADEAVETAQDFERWLSAFQQHGFQVTGKLPLRLNVVLFRHDLDFRRHGGDDIAGYHVAGVLYEPWVVMPARYDDQALLVFRHELTHYIAGLAMPHQPAWFAEGLASYFESANFQGDLFTIGSIPVHHARLLVDAGPLHTTSLFSPQADHHTARFYATSWLVVHYLMSEHGEAFERYQLELGRGRSHEQAWAAAFPALSPAQLDAKVLQYLHGQAFAKYQLRVDARPGKAVSHALSRADEHALQGLLWASRCDGCRPEDQDARASASMQAALREDPYQPQAVAWNLMHATTATQADVMLARDVTRRHPDAWLGYLALGFAALSADVYPSVREEVDPVNALFRLVPASPYPHVLAAFQYGLENKRALALQEAERARKKAPSNPVLLAMQAQLLASLAACEELDETLSLLMDIAHASGETALSARQLAQLKLRCLQDRARTATLP